jgi:hypothetical protein
LLASPIEEKPSVPAPKKGKKLSRPEKRDILNKQGGKAIEKTLCQGMKEDI